MQDHFNGLTHAEAERLAMLAEEAAEVIQVVGKTSKGSSSTQKHSYFYTAITSPSTL